MNKNILFILSIIPPLLVVQFLAWDKIIWLRGLLIWYTFAFLILSWLSLKLNDSKTPEIEENTQT